MKVSIITATYNSSQFIEDCIQSVVMQSHADIEHIIVDGDSSDDTIKIVRKYSNNISKFISEKDNGMYDAINKGMKMATGDIIGILNSDDMLASADVISNIVKIFSTQNVDCTYGDLAYVDQNDTNKMLRFWKGVSYNRLRFMYGWMPAHPTFYIRREIIDELGGYESHYITAADYEFMARLLYHFRISSYYIPKLIVRMRFGGASNKSIHARLRANRRDYLAMKKNKIPLPFIVSVLKPTIKLHQYYYSLFNKFV